MAINFNTLLARVANLQAAALAAHPTSPKSVVAKPFFIYWQGSYPYFTNRLENVPIEGDSEDFDDYTVSLVMRFIVGHVTEGYEGEPESALYLYSPYLVEYFNERTLLIDDTYTTEIDYLNSARLTNWTGLRIFQTAGVPAQQVGAEFTLLCDLSYDIYQARE